MEDSSCFFSTVLGSKIVDVAQGGFNGGGGDWVPEVFLLDVSTRLFYYKSYIYIYIYFFFPLLDLS